MSNRFTEKFKKIWICRDRLETKFSLRKKTMAVVRRKTHPFPVMGPGALKLERKIIC